jgi:dTMP kinase
MFIVLEGVDGCGKTTQAKLLKKWLEKKGYEVLLTAEPTMSKIGKFIREVLSGASEVDPKTLALLFTADRYEHLRNEVEPALSEGKVVISERYYHSTITYQEAQGVERNWLLEMNKFARKPDITIFLDIDPKLGAKRTKTQEIFEKEDFLERVRENYLKFNQEVMKINAQEASIEEVFFQIKEVVNSSLS